MRSILLLNLNHIGDVLFTTPAMRAIRERYPSARITCVAAAGVGDVLRHNPNIDQLVLTRGGGAGETLRTLAKLRPEKLDLSVCFAPNSFRLAAMARLAGAKERIGFDKPPVRRFLTRRIGDNADLSRPENYLELAKAAGAEDKDYRMELHLAEDDIHTADSLLAEEGHSENRPLVGIQPGASTAIKQWSTDRFAAVADRLRKSGMAVVILGAPSEVHLAEKIAGAMETTPVVTAGKMSIGVLGGVISRCNVLITGDTGPLHMAVSLGIPTIGIFGPTDPRRTGPYKGKSITLWQQLPCSPCWHKPTCANVQCMDAITADMVYDATVQMLDSIGSPKPSFAREPGGAA